ncbi:TIGR04282 family arsenosugar biosynthesis glycosyltransferase [Actinokineospora sp. NPDC004072]
MSTVLVMAEAPVAGVVRTGLCPPASPGEAADLAAAALLDTLAAARETAGVRVVVAMAGDVRGCARADEVAEALAGCVVIAQRGLGVAARVVNAHADVAGRYPGESVVQIGVGTPQISPGLLRGAMAELERADAVVGLALGGGWWALGLRDPRWAAVVRGALGSGANAGVMARRALVRAGRRVVDLPRLSDVDTIADVDVVAAAAPATRFAEAALLLRARL